MKPGEREHERVERSRPTAPPRGERAVAALLVLATAFVLRAGRGYRSFPSQDDFNYVPVLWHGIDPTLFARDLVVSGVPSHIAVWTWPVRLFEATVGLANGYWLLTLALSVVSVAAVHRLIRSLGGSGWLTPLAAALAFEGAIPGVGRGVFDGAFGDAFHAQWPALACVLFAQDALVRRRTARCGALLGLALACHPVAGAQGAFVLGVAVVLGGLRRRPGEPGPARALLAVWGIAGLVSAPLTLPLLARALAGAAEAPGWPLARLVDEAYAPRFGVLFDMVPRGRAGVATGVFLLAGLAAALGLPGRAARTVVALLVGQLLLLAAGAVFYGPLRHAASLPYLLDLGRLSPLILVQVAVLLVVALERRLERIGPDLGARRRALAWGLGGLALVAGWVGPAPAPCVAVSLALVTLAARRRADGLDPSLRRLRLGTVALTAVALVVSAGWVGVHDVPAAPEPAADAELHAWVRASTPRDALFIIPPGSMGFRTRTRRSVYVDWKFFPSGARWLAAEWRRRIVLVASPDARALAARGTPAAREWDRCYALAVTPARAAELLAATGADYLVREADDAPDDPRAPVVFRNERFVVHARPSPPSSSAR